MNEFDSLRAITRRALRINYISPMVCMNEVIVSGSGSGSSSVSTLDILPTFRVAGPASLTLSLSGPGQVLVGWTAVPGAYAYVVERSSSELGLYEVRASGVVDLALLDPADPGTWFYRVFGIEPSFGLTFSSPVSSILV